MQLRTKYSRAILAFAGLALGIAFGANLKAAEAFDGSPFYDRQELHRRGYLAAFDCDKLLFHYRALAGLPQPPGVAGGYDGWNSGFIRGHMVGHYLSAASRMAAATGDELFRRRVDYVVEELGKCQDALKLDGYLAAFPVGAFDHLEGRAADNAGVVVPYYTVHKLLAGLLDAHRYVGNAHALQVAERMADYFEKRLAALEPAQLEKIFRTDGSRNPQNEFGAMSDALAELSVVTGERKHLDAARLFNRPWFVDPLARGEDHLAGLHANTRIAAILGLAYWISQPAVLTLNGELQERAGKPSTYTSLKRKWQEGDVVTLALPAALRLERAKDNPAMVSVFFGPVLLAGELGRENLPNDFADKDAHLKLPAVPVPEIVSASANPSEWLHPLPGAALAFKAHDVGAASGIVFRPLYEIHHQRYSVYWLWRALEPNGTGGKNGERAP